MNKTRAATLATQVSGSISSNRSQLVEHNHLSGVHTCVSTVDRSRSGVADLQVTPLTCQTFTALSGPFCLSCFDRSDPSCLSCFDRSDPCLSCFDRSDSCLSCFDRYPPSNRDRARNFAHEQRPLPTGDRTSRSGASADNAALGARRMAHAECSGYGRVGFHRRSPFIFHLRRARFHLSIPNRPVSLLGPGNQTFRRALRRGARGVLHPPELHRRGSVVVGEREIRTHDVDARRFRGDLEAGDHRGCRAVPARHGAPRLRRRTRSIVESGRRHPRTGFQHPCAAHDQRRVESAPPGDHPARSMPGPRSTTETSPSEASDFGWTNSWELPLPSGDVQRLRSRRLHNHSGTGIGHRSLYLAAPTTGQRPHRALSACGR